MLGSGNLNLNRTENKLNLSKLYEVHKGGFGFLGKDEDGVNTYITSHRVDELIEDLVTFETLTSDKQWPVSQIIQREINLQRVKNIAHQYITKPDSIKYFPPITVVLLPIEKESRHIAREFDYSSSTYDDDYRRMITQKWEPIVGGEYRDLLEYIKKSENESLTEGLYELLIDKDFGYRVLAWDNTKYSAVVIDGQHRLEALKIAMQENNSYAGFMQDVVFIDISKQAKRTKQTPVELVRKIFIDINSNAEEVSSARKYVMDDKDLASLFVQTLVNDDDPDNNRENKFILPQLIDWHAENLKHELPHITGIMVLYQLMSDYVLNSKNLISIDDLRKEKKVEKWVEYLNSNFKVDENIKHLSKYNGTKKLVDSLNEFKKEIKPTKDEIKPIDDTENKDTNLESYLFQYDYHILKIAQEYFEKNYSKALVRFFTGLKPYQIVIENLKKENVFNQESNYYKLIVTHPKKIDDDGKKLISELKRKLQIETDDKYYLILTVLGQKATFSMLYDYLMKKMQSGVSEEKAVKATDDFLEKINKLFTILNFNEYKVFEKDRKPCITRAIRDKNRINEYGKQASYFWEDIVYKDTSIIYNSQGILSLKQTLQYMLDSINQLEKDNISLDDNIFPERYVKVRIKRRVLSEHQESEATAKTVSEDILKAKKEFLDNFLIESFNKYKQSQELSESNLVDEFNK
jgi:DGQHR domain-containing protein